MKMLRILLVIAMVCGFAVRAKADDFQMIVVDPSYSINTINTPNFTVTFAPCVSPGQVPSGTSYVGCYTVQNETAAAITSLTMDIGANVLNQTASCGQGNLGGKYTDYFDMFTCTTEYSGNVITGYTLVFFDGKIPVDGIFTFAEAGADPSAFPDNIGVTATLANTPEPESLMLVSSGLLFAGSLVRRRRKA